MSVDCTWDMVDGYVKPAGDGIANFAVLSSINNR